MTIRIASIKAFICVTIIVSAPISGFAQDILGDMDKILIRNVSIPDRQDDSKVVVVSILIEDKLLEMVTRDRIPLGEADISFDAGGGFILGTLEVGSPAGFIILAQDPRDDIEVILDTKDHAVFAIAKGEVVLNKLIRIDVDIDEQPRGWLSYSPPPFALPISYQNKRKWNVFRTKPITVLLFGAIILENTRWLSNDPVNEKQVGDLSKYEGGSVRGFRAGVGGTFNFERPWTYIFSFGTRAFERGFEQSNLNEFVTFDYRVDIPVGSGTVSVGKQKETISIQRLLSMVYAPSQQERASVADGLLPARNVGIVYANAFASERITFATGVFNNWYEVGRSFSENPTVVTGRVSGLPFLSSDESSLLHLAVAGRYSNAEGGITYRAKTEIFSGPVSVDTGLMEDAESTFHVGLELAWRTGPFVLLSEYLQSNVTSASHSDPQFSGYYAVASYTLTGEMRGYRKRSGIFSRMKTANDVTSGGWGSWEVYSRWSSIDLNHGTIDGGKMTTFSLGFNWWPVGTTQANVGYRYSELDRYGLKGFNHGMVVRIALYLE